MCHIIFFLYLYVFKKYLKNTPKFVSAALEQVSRKTDIFCRILSNCVGIFRSGHHYGHMADGVVAFKKQPAL